MARRKHPRYEVQGAWVAWEYWTFWHRFRSGRISAARRHELLNIGLHALEFATIDPPEEGADILLNVFFPSEPFPFVLRGNVAKVRSREGHRSRRVKVQFRKCPESLAVRIREIAETTL